MGTTLLRGRAARRWMVAAGLALAATPGCDFLDPTRVENPQTTTEDLARAAQPTAALVAGMEAQFARALGAVVVATEATSDNYSIHATGYSQEVDDPYLIVPSVTSLNATGGPYFLLQELRALGDFVIDQIAPQDPKATDADLARAHFYRGMAFLLQGENFTAVPVQPDGQPVPARELLTRAVADLEKSIARAPKGELTLAARAVLARAHRDLGDPVRARQFASAALAADPNFVVLQEYDVSSVSNLPFIFLVGRPAQEMQPLPRLDFLDPKYIKEDGGIPFAKAEEMHLILAEADLASGQGASAMQHLARAIELARSRPVVDYFDTDARFNAGLVIRPRDREIQVRADASSPFRSGLILGNGTRFAPDKQQRGDVRVPVISGTSLRADSVRGLSAQAERLHAFWLARQEILFLEGHRMHDLGIRLPISQREIDASPTIEEGGPGTTVVVPNWIPRGGAMDLFTPTSPYVNPSKGDKLSTDRVTIQVDMNRVLTENFARVSPFLRR